MREPDEALAAARLAAGSQAPEDGPPWTLEDPAFSATRLVESSLMKYPYEPHREKLTAMAKQLLVLHSGCRFESPVRR